MRGVWISLLALVLAATVQAEDFKGQKVTLGKKKCTCDFTLDMKTKCKGSAKCDKRCTGKGTVEVGGCSFSLLVKKGGKGTISKCACAAQPTEAPAPAPTGTGSGSGSGETPVPITGPGSGGSGSEPMPPTGGSGSGAPPAGGEGMQCVCKCDCPDGAGECDCDCNCPMTSKAVTCSPGFSKVCPMTDGQCPMDMEMMCPKGAMSRMASGGQGSDKGCQCVPDFLISLVMPSAAGRSLDRASGKVNIKIGKKTCKCSYGIVEANCKKSKFTCDKKCSGKATGVELEDGMYVMDLIIRKGKVTIAKCDKEEGPAPTGPGTGGSGNGGEGSGSGNGGEGTGASRCACVSKGMGGTGPSPPTGSGSGSGPAPPTGSGSGSGPAPPTGSGSGSEPGSGSGSGPGVSPIQQRIMDDIVGVWNLFRDPLTGFWCDSLWISTDDVVPCGPDNNFYSSAGVGMGLVTEAIMAEIGYQTKSEARTRVVQTLTNLLADWPRETFSGFLIHYTTRDLGIISEFSTIDTTICVLGALFAGNYFGGEVESLAAQLRDATQWSDAIEAGNLPGIVATVDYNTGAFAGDIRPFNEYYLVAYIANLTSPVGSEANKYFERYMGTSGEPPGDGTYPYHKSYKGYDLLTDYPTIFMSSFIPQFNFYLARGYQNNQYYKELNTRWLKADKLWWSNIITKSSTIWGTKVHNRVWGAGAGPCPTGYCVDKIKTSEDLIVSAAIMAGFLPNTDTEELRQEINNQLEWLYKNEVCSYPVPLGNGTTYKVLWRCSVKKQSWRCPSIDSIDFSTSILGYASNFLPTNFYNDYAA